MLIAPMLHHLVHASGTLPHHHAQWVVMKGYPGGDVGILNVYAPHTLAERIQLWQSIESSLPSGIRWILVGDWNMVLDTNDNSHPSSKVDGVAEQFAFVRMTSFFGVDDFFHATPLQLQFSWDNRHRVGTRKLKWLDRYYVFPSSTGPPSFHILRYEILGNCSISDHLPVALSIAFFTRIPKELALQSQLPISPRQTCS
jgi:hypothetical protein